MVKDISKNLLPHPGKTRFKQMARKLIRYSESTNSAVCIISSPIAHKISLDLDMLDSEVYKLVEVFVNHRIREEFSNDKKAIASVIGMMTAKISNAICSQFLFGQWKIYPEKKQVEIEKLILSQDPKDNQVALSCMLDYLTTELLSSMYFPRSSYLKFPDLYKLNFQDKKDRTPEDFEALKNKIKPVVEECFMDKVVPLALLKNFVFKDRKEPDSTSVNAIGDFDYSLVVDPKVASGYNFISPPLFKLENSYSSPDDAFYNKSKKELKLGSRLWKTKVEQYSQLSFYSAQLWVNKYSDLKNLSLELENLFQTESDNVVNFLAKSKKEFLNHWKESDYLNEFFSGDKSLDSKIKSKVLNLLKRSIILESKIFSPILNLNTNFLIDPKRAIGQLEKLPFYKFSNYTHDFNNHKLMASYFAHNLSEVPLGISHGFLTTQEFKLNIYNSLGIKDDRDSVISDWFFLRTNANIYSQKEDRYVSLNPFYRLCDEVKEITSLNKEELAVVSEIVQEQNAFSYFFNKGFAYNKHDYITLVVDSLGKLNAYKKCIEYSTDFNKSKGPTTSLLNMICLNGNSDDYDDGSVIDENNLKNNYKYLFDREIGVGYHKLKKFLEQTVFSYTPNQVKELLLKYNVEETEAREIVKLYCQELYSYESKLIKAIEFLLESGYLTKIATGGIFFTGEFFRLHRKYNGLIEWMRPGGYLEYEDMGYVQRVRRVYGRTTRFKPSTFYLGK